MRWNQARWTPCRAPQCVVAAPRSLSLPSLVCSLQTCSDPKPHLCGRGIKRHGAHRQTGDTCSRSRGRWELRCLNSPLRPDLQAGLRLSHVTCAHFTRHLFILALLVFFLFFFCRVREVQSSADVSSPQGKVVGFQADYFHGCIVTFNATSKDFSGFF